MEKEAHSQSNLIKSKNKNFETYIFFSIIISAIIFPILAYLLAIILLIKELVNFKNSEVLKYAIENKCILFSVLAIVISLIFSKYMQISMFFATIIFVCIFIVSYVSTTGKNYNYDNILKLVYILSLITFIYGVFQMINPQYTMPAKWVDSSKYELDKRMFSTFYNPNVYGFYLNLIILTICIFKNTLKNKKWEIIEKLVFIIALLCLFYTFSRTAWISLIITLFIGGIIFDRKLILYAIIIGIFIFGADFIFGIDRTDISKVVNDSSVSYRFKLWRACIKIIKDNLITGIGFGTFFKYVVEYSTEITKYIEHCHNLYLQIILESGLVGFSTFLVVAFKSAKNTLQRFKINKFDKFNILIMLIAGMTLIHGLADSVALTPQMMIILSIFIGISIAKYRFISVD